MAPPKLTFATRRRYDTTYLLDGTIRVKGYDIEYLDYRGPGGLTTFFREMVTTLPYDIGEQAFAHYLIAKDRGKPLTAIPVFPSRFFPHFGVSVTKRSGVQSPQDLVGKTVAVPDWGFNPGVWMRGILTHQYDVPVEKIRWLENEEEPLFRGLDYPRSPRFEIRKVRVDDDGPAHGFLPAMERGEVDAAFLAAGGMGPTGGTRKLLEDPYREVRAYVADTGIFPINTLMTLKQEVAEAHPDLAPSLMEAWREAQRLYQQEMERGGERDHMGLDVAILREIGVFPEAHGLEANRQNVRLMVQYCYEQGLITTLFEPEDLFVAGA